MPKQQLNITDFTGGLNCYSDARDIKENQFAQNWNASLDKYGVVRYTGAGTKHITNHPHTNTNFVPGGGLFSFGYDILPNILPDSGNFDIAHEEGTAQEYSATLFDGSSIPGIKLAASSTKVSATDHATDNYYNNMIISIVDGPGKGQSRLITDYTGSSKIARVAAFGNSDIDGTITAIDGDYGSATPISVAYLRVYNFGVTGAEFLHNSKLFLTSNNKLTIITFSNTESTTSAALVNSGTTSDFVTHGTHAAATIDINGQSDVQVAAAIVVVINAVDDITGASDFTASAISDGSANTMVKIEDKTPGREISRNIYMEWADSKNPSATIDIYQPFGYGFGSSSANKIAKCTCSSHSLEAGQYISIATGQDSQEKYDGTYKVLWIETDAFYIESEAGDTTDTSIAFTSVPTSASKYVIYNIESNSNNWSIDGFDGTYDCSKILTNKALGSQVAVYGSLPVTSSKFLSSSTEVTTANTAGDLGYLDLPAQTLYPGGTYTLEFEMSNFAYWQMFVADGDNTDILPGVLIYSPTAGDGDSKDGVLMADNKWIASNEPVSGNELSPFTNIIVNGDFTAISNTSIVVDNGSGYSASTSSTVVAVDGTAPSASNANGKIFTTSTGLPIGVCTTSEITGDDSITLNSLETALADDAALYTLDGWSVEGSDQHVIALPNTIMETDKSLGTSTSATFSAFPTVEQTDGGPDGGHAILLVGSDGFNPSIDSHYIYQDIELDGNCYYHLYFKYAPTSLMPSGVFEMRYDVYNKETGNSLINGWQTTSTGSRGYLNTGDKDECYYRHVNQGYNQGDSDFNFEYVTFFVPPLAIEANDVDVSIRFSSLVNGLWGAIGLSAVSVKKAFPDIVTMVNQQKQGYIPVRFDDGFDKESQTRDSRKGSINPTLNKYKYTFKVPSNFHKKSDWVIRFYGGRFGYTTANATTQAEHHSRYSQVQAVGFNNITLRADSISTQDVNKNVILLNDNTATKSKIYAYYEEYGFWDTDFLEFNSLNIDPYYTYVNGMLQISDTNFDNSSDLMYYFNYDRNIDTTYHVSGFHSSNNVLEFITGGCTGSSLASDSERQRTINLIPIHNFIWGDESGHTMYPPDLSEDNGGPGRLQYDEPGQFNYGSEYNPWHYKWVDALDVNQNIDYVPGLAKTPQTIPVKWVWPDAFNSPQMGGTSYLWDSLGSSGRDHFRTEDRDAVDTMIDNESTSGGELWAKGGWMSHYQSTDPSSTLARGAEDNSYHCYNNPIYLPISGSDLNISMTQQLQEVEEYQGSQPLYMSNLSFDLEIYLTGVNRVETGSYNNWSNSNTFNEQSTSWTRDLDVPQIQVTIYKYDGDLSNIDSIKNLFGDNAEQLFSSIQGMGNGTNSKIMPENTESFASWGSGNTYQGVYMTYDDDFTIYMDDDSGFASHMILSYNFAFGEIPQGQHDGEGIIPSGITSDDSFIMKIEIINDAGMGTNSLLARVGSGPASGNSLCLPQSFGYLLGNWNARFYEEEFNPETSLGGNVDTNGIHVNLDFTSLPEEVIVEEEVEEEGVEETVEGLEGSGWARRTYTLATTTVNIFDEESPLEEASYIFGEEFTIQAGEAPIMNITIGQELFRNPIVKTIKVYMKDNASDIWYLQASVDTETANAKSSTSGVKYGKLLGGESHYYLWIIEQKDLLTFNEVDSYESETLVKQEDAESLGKLTCQYKTAVHVNNRLYVGNIKQGGKTYGDRMLKTPVAKYNIFPASNYIDVAIQDGDEITGLAYYKDRLLQFKKKKVFVINVSGDYEYLEDTFDNIGINKQCQITETPYGVVWVNASGCFLYDGKKMVNLIDGKIGTEDFQENPSGVTYNYWLITEADVPAIGYVKSTKKLIIAKNTGAMTVGGTASENLAGIPDGYQYDFQSQGWTFLYYKVTAAPETTSPSKSGYISNFTNNKNGDIIYYAVDGPGDNMGFNDIYKWTDASTTSSLSNNEGDNFFLRTKDFDFGSPGVRKKIYKVYVTFKSTNGGSAAHSNIKVHYATNGSSSFTEFSNNSTNYSTTNGLTDGASSTGWITAELKPSSSINNIYSFAIRFQGAATNIPDVFEINDYTIVYRIKNVK